LHKGILSTAFLSMSVILLASCATIVSGRNQEVSFHSTPEGATISVGGKIIGKTPLTANLKKKSDRPLVFELDGYKPFQTTPDTHMNGWFWGNLAFGGIIGSSVDGITGSIYEYSPSQYMVALEEEGASSLRNEAEKPIERKTREFIVIAYNNILTDLSKGDGPHLSSLLKLLSIPEGEREDAKKKISALSEVYTDIPDFADHVIDLFTRVADQDQ